METTKSWCDSVSTFHPVLHTVCCGILKLATLFTVK